jgi:tetratricopeptide (TPR) repeat protein
MKRLLTCLAAVMAVMAIGLTQVSAQGPTGTPVPPSEPPPDPLTRTLEEAVEWAQRASQDSSRAVDAANAILGLIQAASILLGAVLAAAGLFGLTTLLDFNRQKNEFRKEIDAARTRLREFEERIRQEAAEVRNQGNRSIRALTLLQLGKQQMDGRNYDAAQATLQQAYENDPTNPAINYFMGELYIILNRMDEAIDRLKEAGAEYDDQERMFPAAKAAYAYALRRKGDKAIGEEKREYYRKSEWHFSEALKRNPSLLGVDGESWWGSLGGLYQRQERYSEAIACYENAIAATKSTSSYPYNNLGILYTIQHNPEQAKKNFRQAAKVALQRLDDKPHDYWARFDLVTAQIALNDAVEVFKQLPQAMASAPRSDRLDTFMSGLTRLRRYAPSEMIDKVIEAVDHEMGRRKAQEEQQEG